MSCLAEYVVTDLKVPIFNREGIVIYIQFHPSFVDERLSKDQWCTFTIHLFLQILKVVHSYVCVPFKGHTIDGDGYFVFFGYGQIYVEANKHA